MARTTIRIGVLAWPVHCQLSRSKPHHEATAGLVAPGGLLLVDNIFGSSVAWIDELAHPDAAATDRMNRRAAADDRFDAAGVFVRAGLLVARRRPGP